MCREAKRATLAMERRWLRCKACALVSAAAWLACLLVAPSPAWAIEYETFVQVQTEEELQDLLAGGQIDETTYDALLELLHNPIELNSANRDTLYSLPNLSWADVDAILEYRKAVGVIRSVDDLWAAGVLSRKVVESLRPFVILRPRQVPWRRISGSVGYRTLYLVGEQGVPPMWFQGELESLRHLRVKAVGVVENNRVYDVRYDMARDALGARPPATRLRVPKFYAEWDDGNWQVLAGTFTAGFGQRLTFDNTALERPNGLRRDDTIYYRGDLTLACKESAGQLPDSPCAGQEAHRYEAPDYGYTKRLRGVGLGVRQIELGKGFLQLYLWGSYERKDVYQYEIYDRSRCDDPTADDDPSCAAPAVYRLAPADAETTEFKYQTLPDMYDELLGGGNVAYFLDGRTHIGLTGYAAYDRWLVEGMDLDFQEWARAPYGGPFGAIGTDAAYGSGIVDLWSEFTRSMDSQPQGGGFAGIAGATFTVRDHTVDLAARYYDRNFANPYARPLSEADEYDGLRARDEVGVLARYTGRVGEWRFRGLLDFWTTTRAASGGRPLRFRTYDRVDYALSGWFVPGIYLEFYDKDLRTAGRGQCFDWLVESGDSDGYCRGERVRLGAVLQFRPLSKLRISAQYQHSFVDDAREIKGEKVFGNNFRQDLTTYLTASYEVSSSLTVRARLRYLNEALGYSDYLEESLSGYLEGVFRLSKRLWGRVRYEVYALLDQRESTMITEPNPAHMIRFESQVRF